MHLHVRLYFFTSSCIYHVEHSIPLRLSNFRHTHLFFTHETCVQCKHVNTNTKHTVRCSSSNTRVEAATNTQKTHSRSTQSGVEAATNVKVLGARHTAGHGALEVRGGGDVVATRTATQRGMAWARGTCLADVAWRCSCCPAHRTGRQFLCVRAG